MFNYLLNFTHKWTYRSNLVKNLFNFLILSKVAPESEAFVIILKN